MERAYFVYLIASKWRALYVGMTGNLPGRVGQHKDGFTEGFTADYKCTRLVWYEKHQYVRNAIMREKQIRRWRREKKVWLIEQSNPARDDLAADWWSPVKLYSQP